MPTIKNEAIVLCRVSSKEQAESGFSLEAQEKLLLEYANKPENKFKVIKVFKISESASGKEVRKKFNEILGFVRKHNIAVILCEKIDRWTRNLKDAAIASDWVLERDGNSIHFVKENFIVSKHTRAHENLVWDMKVAIARFYTNNLSEEVRKGQKEKLAQGQLPTKPPLGYMTIGEKGHKIHIIDKQIAPLVIKMFELYATGNYSLTRVSNELYKMGMRGRSGKRVPENRIYEYYKDPFYYGKMRWKGEIYRATHEPLITKDLFDKVQVTLKRKVNNPHYSKHNQIFKAKVYCEHCGGMLTWELQKGRYYGHCSNHKKYRNCPKKTYIREEDAENQVKTVFDVIAPANEAVLEWIENVIRNEYKDQISKRETEIKRLNGHLSSIREQKDKLFMAKINREVPLEFCERKIAELTEDEQVFEDAFIKISDKSDEFLQLQLIIHELAFKSMKIYEQGNPDEKRLLFSQLFTNLIQDGLKIKTEYTLAAQYLVNWVPKLNKYYERHKNYIKQRKTGGLAPASPIELAWRESLRTIKWEDVFPYPSVSILQIKQLLLLK